MSKYLTVDTTTGAYTDTAAFLTVIGRDCAQYASKIGSWETLMTADTRRLRELGVADAPKRKYILSWVGYYK